MIGILDRIVKYRLVRERVVVDRKDIYAGYLVNDNTIYRGILFTIDKNGLAKDLIYTCPSYPIQNYDEDVINDGITVGKYINLEPLLKLMNLDEKLTQRELNQLLLRFRNPKWVDKLGRLCGINPLSESVSCEQLTSELPYEIYEILSTLLWKRTKPHVKELSKHRIVKRRW